MMDIDNRTRIINDCQRIIRESSNFDTVKMRLDLAIDQANNLINNYEVKGIQTIIPSARIHLDDLKKNYDQYLAGSLIRNFKKVLDKISKMKTEKGKKNNIDKFLIQFSLNKEQIKDETVLAILVQEVENQIQSISFE